MSFKVTLSGNFLRSAKKLAKKYPSLKNDLALLIEGMAENPEMGTPLGKNLYKIRITITSKKRGKSGGAKSDYLCDIQVRAGTAGRNLRQSTVRYC